MATNLITRLFKGSDTERLRHQLMTMVHNEQATANRLIAYEQKRNPGRTEQWYLEKVIYDLRR